VEFCEEVDYDLIEVVVMYQMRQRLSFFSDIGNSLAFMNIKYSIFILTVVFVIPSSFQPIYLVGGNQSTVGYFIVLFTFVVVAVVIAYAF
jgi:hypothetical protein